MELSCIFCKKNKDDEEKFVLTDEHVIPQILGGWITIPFVCKTCNNDVFGSNVESILKENAYIVAAIDMLEIQPPDKAYKSADINLEFSETIIAKGKIRHDGVTKFIPTEQKDGSLVAPEDVSKDILRKQIDRYEKEHNVKVNFELDSFDSLPYNIVIPVYGTDICFIKRKKEKAQTTISNLTEPIMFEFPAKVAFEHLSGFSYSFIMNTIFDPFREWILKNDLQNKVLLNTLLSRITNPKDLKYLPYHFIRFSIFDNDLIALVGLFGIIRFSIYLARLENNIDFPDINLLDTYHVYDIKNRNLFPSQPPEDIFNDDTMYMRAVCHLARYHLYSSKDKKVN